MREKEIARLDWTGCCLCSCRGCLCSCRGYGRGYPAGYAQGSCTRKVGEPLRQAADKVIDRRAAPLRATVDEIVDGFIDKTVLGGFRNGADIQGSERNWLGLPGHVKVIPETYYCRSCGAEHKALPPKGVDGSAGVRTKK